MKIVGKLSELGPKCKEEEVLTRDCAGSFFLSRSTESVFGVFFTFKNIFIDYVIIVVPFPPLHSTPSCPPSPSPPPIVHVHGSYL